MSLTFVVATTKKRRCVLVRTFVFTAVVEADMETFDVGREEHEQWNSVPDYIESTLRSNLEYDSELGCAVLVASVIEIPSDSVDSPTQ